MKLKKYAAIDIGSNAIKKKVGKKDKKNAQKIKELWETEKMG